MKKKVLAKSTREASYLSAFIKAVCEIEGKKNQASVGDVREIVRAIADTIMQPNGTGYMHMEAFKKYLDYRSSLMIRAARKSKPKTKRKKAKAGKA